MNRDGSPSELDAAREDAEDRQQLFVQQVAEALAPQHVIEFDSDSVGRAWAQKFAPRVAAAIQATMQKTDSFCPWWVSHGGLTPEASAECRSEIQASALAALRGKTPEGEI